MTDRTVASVVASRREINAYNVGALMGSGVTVVSIPRGGGSEAIASDELMWLNHLNRMLAHLASASTVQPGVWRILTAAKPVDTRRSQAAALISAWLDDESDHDERFWPILENDLAEAE